MIFIIGPISSNQGGKASTKQPIGETVRAYQTLRRDNGLGAVSKAVIENNNYHERKAGKMGIKKRAGEETSGITMY